MLSYELCQKLKEAGFPQKEYLLRSSEDIEEIDNKRIIALLFQHGEWGFHQTFDYSVYPHPQPDNWEERKPHPSSLFSRKYLDSEEGRKYTVYVPTLSELIEACNGSFESLSKDPCQDCEHPKWIAHSIYQPFEKKDFLHCGGQTPEEAVANFYLELQKHH